MKASSRHRWRGRALKRAVIAVAIVATGAATGLAAASGQARSPATTPATTTAGSGLFGYLEFPSDQLLALPLWLDALKRIAEERIAIARCDDDVGSCGSSTLTVWRAKVHELRTLEAMQRLIEVNRFVNGFAARASKPGAANHWASPLEFLAQGGDAEDVAVMKFVTLRNAGVTNESLRIVIVYDTLKQQRHAVLAATLAEGTFILDTVSNAVLPAERLKYYLPYYSMNETTRWAHVVRRQRASDG